MSETDFSKVVPRISDELKIGAGQVAAVIKLLEEDNTIPFIARYRKEVHGNLDEVQISSINDRLKYHKELEDRRETILKSIESQGKLTDDLREKIEACTQKAALEDLYLPYKPKRRTRATIAKEKGLEPLADIIWAQGRENPTEAAEAFVDAAKGVETADAALAGARDICAERIADNADVRGYVRRMFKTKSKIKSEVAAPKPTEPTKFEQYYDFEEAFSEIPSHRYLALRRGQAENILWIHLILESGPIVDEILKIIDHNDKSPLGEQLRLSANEAYRRLIAPSAEIDAMIDKKSEADIAAVEIFAENLRHLLLAAPLGEKTVIAIDPGIRTGCKVAVLDSTGKFLANDVIYPTRHIAEAQETLALLIEKYKPVAIAVGNGTAGRETEAFAREVIKLLKKKDIMVVSVSEAGASVYSASDIARKEFPDLDLTVRGAISIGRRLQDPLAELVKIDPKAIGVGQYQHDVYQQLLSDKLDEVVISCVNKVGVELNTASAPLLTRVSGISSSLAERIVNWRNENGAFKSRSDLKKVSGLGPKAFEQSAGFLRIRGAKNPLDASAVHPERYTLVKTMAQDIGVEVGELVGNASLAEKIVISKYITDDVGELTIKDIIDELKRPGRDPRAVFEKPSFREDVMTIDDVSEGMELEGIVTNVTAFGAFVDIGIHQDGLVHVSEIADHFVRDPAEVVKTGDKIKVKVIGVDTARNRVSLSARTKPRPAAAPRSGGGMPSRSADRRPQRNNNGRGGFSCNPFANL